MSAPRSLIPRLILYAVRLGPRFLWLLFRAYVLDGALMKLLPLYALAYRRWHDLLGRLTLRAEMARFQRRRAEIMDVADGGYVVSLDQLGLESRQLDRCQAMLAQRGKVVLGELDQDGYLLSRFGPIPGVALTAAEQFIERPRLRVELVAIERGVGIRKTYRGNRRAFLNELSALHLMRSESANVPPILDIDFESLSITVSFIAGVSLEHALSEHGAALQHRDERVGQVQGSTSKVTLAYFEQGANAIREHMSAELVEFLYEQVRIAHRAGIELYDIKYGNIIVERDTGEPFMIDFDSSRCYRSPRGLAFLAARDRDTDKFNAAYGANKATYQLLRSRIQDHDFPAADKLYAPVYLGHGLRVGRLWDIAVGFGRWHFILKKSLPELRGKRLLSLGPNNGANELEMLRHGAVAVVAVELDETWSAQGQFITEAREWADNAQYDLRYVQGDMGLLSSMDIGRVDCAFALCSLYYLDGDGMKAVASHVRTLTDTFVLQCNVGREIGRLSEDDYRRASVQYAVDLLRAAGFTQVHVTAPRGYSRPLVTGSAER